tara:strand:- start:271 stop:543 length:273 start_codon:yes stop_codon:yes gene_type:complete
MITGKFYKKGGTGSLKSFDAAFLKDDSIEGYCHILVFEYPDAPDDSGNLDSAGSPHLILDEIIFISQPYVARVRKLESIDSSQSAFYIQN